MPVYAIQSGENGPIKIGYSDDPISRMAHFQVGNPVLCVLLGVSEGGLEAEVRIHALLSKHRIRGEWFEPVQEVLDVVGRFTPLPEKGLKDDDARTLAQRYDVSVAAAYKWRKRGIPLWAQIRALNMAVASKDAA